MFDKRLSELHLNTVGSRRLLKRILVFLIFKIECKKKASDMYVATNKRNYKLFPSLKLFKLFILGLLVKLVWSSVSHVVKTTITFNNIE